MKPSGYFFLGLFICLLLFLPAVFFASLLYNGAAVEPSSAICLFYQIIHIAITLCCTGMILNKLNQKDHQDDQENQDNQQP